MLHIYLNVTNRNIINKNNTIFIFKYFKKKKNVIVIKF